MKPLLIAALAIAAVACSDSHDKPVPKRTAYPRTELYADSSVAATVGPLAFDIPAQAGSSAPRPGWLDIEYPRYNASMLITVLTLDSDKALDAVLANRRRRMALNLGEHIGTETDFANSTGFRCHIIECFDGCPTPVQFLAYDKDARTVVSGTALIKGPTEPADSLAPTLRAIGRDATKLLKSLRKK